MGEITPFHLKPYETWDTPPINPVPSGFMFINRHWRDSGSLKCKQPLFPHQGPTSWTSKGVCCKASTPNPWRGCGTGPLKEEVRAHDWNQWVELETRILSFRHFSREKPRTFSTTDVLGFNVHLRNSLKSQPSVYPARCSMHVRRHRPSATGWPLSSLSLGFSCQARV